MYNKDTITLTWADNTLVDVEIDSVDDIGWESLYRINSMIETQREFDNRIDHLTRLSTAVSNKDQSALNRVYSDCDPEEPNTIVYVALHQDNTVEIITYENDPHGDRFVAVVNLAKSNQLNNLYQIDIEDNLL